MLLKEGTVMAVMRDNQADLVAERLRLLRQPRHYHQQSLWELWQIMKTVLQETRKARAEEESTAALSASSR
jgi:hypothetical protein